jgi:hypothetical protein
MDLTGGYHPRDRFQQQLPEPTRLADAAEVRRTALNDRCVAQQRVSLNFVVELIDTSNNRTHPYGTMPYLHFSVSERIESVAQQSMSIGKPQRLHHNTTPDVGRLTIAGPQRVSCGLGAQAPRRWPRWAAEQPTPRLAAGGDSRSSRCTVKASMICEAFSGGGIGPRCD